MSEMWPPRVTYGIDSLEPSGAEWSLLAMAPHLLGHGVEMEIVHFATTAGLGPRFEELGVRVISRPGRRSRAARAWAIRDLLRSRPPDLVHTTLFEADVAGRLAAHWCSIPCVSSLVNTAYGPEHRSASRIPRWKLEAARALDLVTARSVTRFHAISDTVATDMARRLRIDPRKIDVVPRGRDSGALGRRSPDRRARVRAALGIPEGAPVVLCVGRHEHQKALDVAVAAFAAVHSRRPDARLLVAGREGNATAQLHQAIRSSGASEAVRLLGWRCDVPDLLTAADVLLFPSRWEGLGSVLLEAMALETPIVASDLPVLRELLVDDDGEELAWFAPVDDPQAVADRCLEALSGADGRVVEGRKRFQRRYTAEAAASGLVDIYRRALQP